MPASGGQLRPPFWAGIRLGCPFHNCRKFVGLLPFVGVGWRVRASHKALQA
jgi:hypothetical protein